MNIKVKFNQCLKCRYEPEGIVSNEMRLPLCDYCKDGSNFSQLRIDDITKIQEQYNQKGELALR